MSQDIRELLCAAPDTQLDAAMKPLIKAWDDPPKAVQVLEVLDHVIHGALGSSFIVATLQAIYATSCSREGTTHEEVVKGAHWREKLDNLGGKNG